MKTNVVKLPLAYKGIRNAEAVMNIIRTEIYASDIELLAVRVGVSKSCLFSIRSGRTKWPRHATFFALIDALDLELYLKHRGQ